VNVGRAAVEQFPIDQAAGIDDDIGGVKQSSPLDGDQFDVAWTSADE
jgi:hypothetical protein